MDGVSPEALVQVRFDRFVLQRPLTSDAGSQTWEAVDEASRRAVCLQLLAEDDPRFAAVLSEVTAARELDDPRLVRILDLVRAEGQLGVVTQWVPGRPWSELLAEGLHLGEAVIVAYEVAAALRGAHALGITHGRLRPSSVIISADGGVRLRGLGVDGAMSGSALAGDAKSSDLRGVGCLLFAGLTARWPSIDDSALIVDGLPVVLRRRGRFPRAIDLDERVPRRLSVLAEHLMTGGRDSRSLRDIDAAAAALARAVARETGQRPETSVSLRDETDFRRLGQVVAASAVIAVLAVGGYRLASSVLEKEEAPVAAGSESSGDSATAPDQLATPVVQEWRVVASQDFDPEGNQSENTNLVPLATDGSLETAWETVVYKEATMGAKRGVGVVLDLGEPREISSVELDLRGSGTDLELRVSDSLAPSVDGYRLVASVADAGEQVVLSPADQVDGRYMLIWLTKVPQTPTGTMGAISEVRVFG